MAVVAFEIEQPAAGHGIPEGVKIVKWVLSAGDTGAPYVCPHYADKTVQASGTFGGTVTLQGSNEIAAVPTAWSTLHDPSQNDLAYTAAGMDAILENPYQIRPSLSAGGPVTVRVVMTTAARR
jgi:hypothetical protein